VNPPALGIFIPAYNAGATLDAVLERIPAALWPRVRVAIVVDDGSRDDTASVARAWGAKVPAVRVHSFAANRGYGGAVRHGLAVCREAECDIAVCLHADGQYPPERIADFAAHMERHGIDLLQGSRHLDGRALAGGMPLYKYVAGKVLTRLENACLGHRLTDPHSGFLLYGRRALEALPLDRLSGYFDFDLEVIACALASGLRVGELAIPARYGPERSHLNPLRYGLRALLVAARYRTGHYRRLIE
jgi:glycosyltransferase involved in cell wall biosynthesis